jgi:hypothetical protein
MNARGWFVGNYQKTANGTILNFLFKDGHFFDVPVPGTGGNITGINGFGELTGFFFDAQNARHGFIGNCN